jgi:transposase-like protein
MTASKKSSCDIEAGVSKRWTAGRKKEAVLRLLKGESVDGLSRELGITIAQLEEWKQTVLERMELLLKTRSDEPLQAELDVAMKRIGELCMENELLKEKGKKQGVFWGGKW